MDDAVDQRIVAEVSRDGRATLADLSAATGLSVSAVQARLKRL
ncbi:AsnC family transcriptional regulator, partial [Pseudoxanthomonas mexicana]